MKKQDSGIYAVYKKPTSDLKTHIDWEWMNGKYILRKWKTKESWSNNLHVRQNGLKKYITRDKEGHYTMVKGSIQKEDITSANICATNVGAPKCIRQTLTIIKGDVNSNT